MALLIFVGLIVATTIFLIIMLVGYISKPSKSQRSLPPGHTGWPILGESLAFAACPENFVQDRMAKHSPAEVFQSSIAGVKMAFLCGPSGNKLIFSNNKKLVKNWWPKSVSKALHLDFKDQSPFLEDHTFLKLDFVQNYVALMDSTARDHIEKSWIPYNQVKVHENAKDFTFFLACRLFINCSDDKVRDLQEPFLAVVKGIFSAPVNLPGTAFRGAVKGGAVIKKKLIDIIRQRKSQLTGRGDCVLRADQDLLNRLLLASDKDGKSFSEEEIANKIVGYFLASFYSTSTAITFVLSRLSEHPQVYNEVLKEQLAIANAKGKEELLTWRDIRKMNYTWNVEFESLRVTSPSLGVPKEVITDFTFAGYDIPKGWKVFWTPHSTNKNPKYFANPEKFDPSRFEGNGPPPFTFVPFGGGPRMCPGKEYARMQILVYLHNVVTRFKFQKVNPNEKIIYDPEPHLAESLPMYLQPLEP